MDFGAFIVTAIIGLAFFVALGNALTAYAAGLAGRKGSRNLAGTLGVLLMLAILFIYKVYILDEGLVGAAMSGDVARVKVLLGRGASPNACREDGKSASQFATDAHNEELVAVLKAAGARERR